jgi:hypothetical protein
MTRFIAACFEIITPESGHLVEGTLVHLLAVNRAHWFFATLVKGVDALEER